MTTPGAPPQRHPIRERLSQTPVHRWWRFAESLIGGRANRATFSALETYCLFLGHGRSGHSIVGALLDAHPEVILADELDVLGYLEAGFSREQILYLSLKVARDQARQQRLKDGRAGTAYSYFVPRQWQGRARRARVIGASRAGQSVHRLAERPELAMRLAETMQGLELRFIQVIRNPYDNIATMMLRSGRTFDAVCAQYFRDWETLERLHVSLGQERVCTTTHEGLLADPKAELRRLCRFLGVVAEDEYLDACASILFRSPSRSRQSVTWTEAQRSIVGKRMSEIELLRNYSFDD